MIRNASSGNVLELENGAQLSNEGVHVYTQSSKEGLALSQLWSITYVPRVTKNRFYIRNVVTGTSLDVRSEPTRAGGEQIMCHQFHGKINQIWEIFGARADVGCVPPWNHFGHSN